MFKALKTLFNYYNNGEFNKNKFFVNNALFGLFNETFFLAIFTPFLRYKSPDPIMLSTLLSIEAVVYFFAVYIGGIIFDRFGAKFTFLLSRFVNIFALFLLLSNNYIILCSAVGLCGFVRGINFGKYDTYIYNTCSIFGLTDEYKKYLSGYFLAWDITSFAMAFGARLILQFHNYEMIVYLSILMQILSVFYVSMAIPHKKFFNQVSKDKHSQSISEILTNIFTCLSENKIVIYLAVFYGFIQYFAYKFPLIIGDMMFIDIGFTPIEMATFASQIAIMWVISDAISLFLMPKKGISLRTTVIMMFCLMMFLLISTIIYNPTMLKLSMFASAMTFCGMEIAIEKSFEGKVNIKIRASILSLATSIAGILNLINTMLIGVLAKYFSYHIGGFIIVAVFFMFTIFVGKKILSFKC